ncbi:hypothetical protein [Flavobacterium sp. LAR06]|uniref:hypothetical protein n=1 Tax=Flavobacterium sp. LAR06 TaxID=3064897 RepID=UPI0035C0943A
MDIISIIKGANPNLVIFCGTTLIAFLTWLLKSLIENPITESKVTFQKYTDKRIEILTEIKTRLNFIAYFPGEKESEEFKNQIQEILLKDGRAGYLNKETYSAILKISIDLKTDETLLIKTIKEIDADLYLQISKIQDEIIFYRKFSNYNPLRRLVGILILTAHYIITMILSIGIVYLFIYSLVHTTIIGNVLVLIVALGIVYLINNWFKRQ